jgi:hypothetical protein
VSVAHRYLVICPLMGVSVKQLLRVVLSLTKFHLNPLPPDLRDQGVLKVQDAGLRERFAMS